MTDTHIQQRRPLVHFQRSAKDSPLAIRPNGQLPPRDLFTAHPDVLEAYDLFVTLREGVTTHHRDARSKRAEAEKARADYRSAVAEALEAGTDPSKLKSKADQLEAEAAAHDGFARTAAGKVERQGAVLGAAIKAVAADCFEVAERDMAEADEQVATALAALTAALEHRATAWAARKWLSNAHLLGGANNWNGANLTAPILDALAAIGSTADDLEVLKADEADLTTWRANN